MQKRTKISFYSYHSAIFGLLLLLCSSCKMSISLSGSDIHPNAKTVSVATFINNATIVNPTLSQDFTTALKDMIQRQTSLALVNHSGDYAFSGSISSYTISPIAIQGTETAAMNRLTISVHIKFSNKFDKSKNFEQTFSRYADYPSNQNFTAVESTLVTQINEALTDDIFNKAFVNW